MAPDRLGTTAATSLRMAKQRRRDTGPEVGLRKALFRRGWRYRVEYPLPGLPRRRVDMAFPRLRVAVFVDGCFWHACPEHGTRPANNAQWWAAKLARNVARDRETDDHLEGIGWQVVRIWEHVPATEAADLVEAALRQRNVTALPRSAIAIGNTRERDRHDVVRDGEVPVRHRC